MKFDFSKELTLFSSAATENHQALDFALSENGIEIEKDPSKFSHIVITTGAYNRGWVGLISYSLADLNKMLENHKKGVTKEDVTLFKGHGGFLDAGGRTAFGAYSRDSKLNKILKMKYKDASGKEYDKYALMLNGTYNEEGMESTKEKELKYVSVEIYNNYKDREISAAMMQFFKVSTVEEAMVKFDERCLENIKKSPELCLEDAKFYLCREITNASKSYGPTIAHVALTNEPFFHLPKVQDITSAQVIESFSMAHNEFSFSVEDKIFSVGKDLFLSLGDGKYADINQFIHDDTSDGRKVREILERYPAVSLTSSPLMFDLRQTKDDNIIEPNVDSDTTKNSVVKESEPETIPDPIVHNSVTVEQEPPKERKMIRELIQKYSAYSLLDLQNFNMTDLSEEDKAAIEFCINKKNLEIESLRAEKTRNEYAESLAKRDQEIAELREKSAQSQFAAYTNSVDSLCSTLNAKGVPKAIVDQVNKYSKSLDPKFMGTKFDFSNADGFSFSGTFVDVLKNIFANVDSSVFSNAAPVSTTDSAEKNKENIDKPVQAFENTEDKLDLAAIKRNSAALGTKLVQERFSKK